MLYLQENSLKSIYDLYVYTSDYEIDINLISQNDKNLIKTINNNISKIKIKVNFYHRTKYSIELIDVLDSTNTQLTNIRTQIESILDQLEFVNDIVNDLSLNMMYVMNGIVRRDNI